MTREGFPGLTPSAPHGEEALSRQRTCAVRCAVSNHEDERVILRDAAKAPLLRMRGACPGCCAARSGALLIRGPLCFRIVPALRCVVRTMLRIAGRTLHRVRDTGPIASHSLVRNPRGEERGNAARLEPCGRWMRSDHDSPNRKMLWHSGLVVIGFRAPVELDGHALDEAVRRFLKFSPFLCFRQPVFHLFPSKRSPLTAHIFQRSKLIFRIHKFPQHLFSLTWSNLHLMKCQLTIS